MELLTDDRLIEVLREAGTGARRVTLGAHGDPILTTPQGTFAISMLHAEVLFETMFGHAPLKKG